MKKDPCALAGYRKNAFAQGRAGTFIGLFFLLLLR
jgi:hypothetical protein